MQRSGLIRACGWLAFWVGLPPNLYFIPSAAGFAVWVVASLTCIAGAAFHLGIGRWWWRSLGHAECRPAFRGFILGAGCQLGLLAFWASLLVTPDSWLGFQVLLAGVGLLLLVGTARRLLRAIASRAAA